MLDYIVSIEGYCVLDYTVSIERLLHARLYCVYRKVIACQIMLCLLKGYCVLDYTVSIERLLRARLYCVY